MVHTFRVVNMPIGSLPEGYEEYVEGQEFTGVAAGSQNLTFSFSKTGRKALREVYVYCNNFGVAAKFAVKRGTATSNVPLTGDIYWNAASFVTFDSPKFANLGLIITVDTNFGANTTVYIVVKYYYET